MYSNLFNLISVMVTRFNLNLFIFLGKQNCDDFLIEVLTYKNITLAIVLGPHRNLEVKHLHPNLHLTNTSEGHTIKVPSCFYTLVTSNVVQSYNLLFKTL